MADYYEIREHYSLGSPSSYTVVPKYPNQAADLHYHSGEVALTIDPGGGRFDSDDSSANKTMKINMTQNKYWYDGREISGQFTSEIDSNVSIYGIWTGTLGTLPDVYRSGYKFSGWFLDYNRVYSGSSLKLRVGSNTTYIIARWSSLAPTTYAVTLDPGQEATTPGTTEYWTYDGSAYSSSSHTTDTKITHITRPQRTGYAFKGYYTTQNPSESDTPYVEEDGEIVFFAHEGKLYAKWERKISITYNGNGNTGGTVPTQENIDYGSSFIIPKNETSVDPLEKTGYDFAGWDTNPHSLPDSVLYPESILPHLITNVTQSINLYAIWKPTTYIHRWNRSENTWDTDSRVYKWSGSSWTNIDQGYEWNGSSWEPIVPSGS